MLSEQVIKDVANQVRSQYPRAWSKCHAEGDPEADDFIILVCKELNRLDRLVGCNGKRATDTLSHDAIYNDGRVVDIVASAGASNASIYYNDVSAYGPGKFINPVPLTTHFSYSGGVTPPVVPPTTKKQYIGDSVGEAIGRALFEDYSAAGQNFNPGAAVWILRVVWDHVNEGLSVTDSIAKHRAEWRKVLGL